ncbi:MAG: Rieske (2Fe-2S) protein [Acidobacteria bacterium]|nr:MAG: Rieske (2Fe-2S) protein [Acidobacteriota bacterium]
MRRVNSKSESLWSEEFAVEAAAEQYVSRRQFSKFLVLTSMGMFVGQIWILVKNWFRPTTVYKEKPVALISEIGIGEVKLFSYPEPADACIMIRTAADHYVAYSQKCTHLSCAVYYEKEANRLECPCHEGYFSVSDGSVLQGPPPRPLPTVVLKREGDNLIATGIKL